MDHDVERVEEAIRKAEALISKDMMELLEEDDEIEITNPKISTNNRYRDEGSRERLIQKLLKEREESLKSRNGSNKSTQKYTNQSHIDVMDEPATSFVDISQYIDLSTAMPCTTGNKSFRRKSVAELRHEKELEHKKECTFKPAITPSRKSSETPADVVERLARPKSEYWIQKEKERKRMEEEELQKACPFKPSITGETPSGKPGNETWQKRAAKSFRKSIPVEQRLHQDASERMLSREVAKREMEQAELASQPYRPVVNPVSEAIVQQIGREPLTKRMESIQREKSEKLSQLQMNAQLGDPNLTFKPSISETSKKIAERQKANNGNEKKDVVERLLSQSENVSHRKVKREQAWAEQQRVSCKFKPRLSENSKKLANSNPETHNLTFIARQEKWAEKSKRNQEKIRLDHEYAENATFKPSIGNSRQIFEATRPELVNETSSERAYRLSVKAQEQKEMISKQRQENYYAQYSFKPSINKTSDAIARETHREQEDLFEELYHNTRGRRLKELIQSQVEDEQLGECTFKPRTLNKPYASASNIIRSLKENPAESMKAIEESKILREKRLVQMRKEKEYEELEECTFAPTILGAVPEQPAGPVIVKGLSRHLELQELAKRQQAELEERSRKAFLTNVMEIESVPFTVPQPFNLSVATRNCGHVDAVDPECTFRPHTNVSRSRKQMKNILESYA